jgi:prevent-host-death family protein
MPDVSATEAARKFADLLDAVERGEHFTIVRRGKAVAHLEPAARGRGLAIKQAMRAHAPDAQWAREVDEVRRSLSLEERP